MKAIFQERFGPPEVLRLASASIVSNLDLRPGAFAHGRRLLRLVPIEDALGAVELAGHVIGVVVDLPGRAPQRVVGDVRSKHARLDAGGLDDVPDRLIVPVEVVREPDEIEAGIAGARALPVDDPGEGAVVAGEDVVGVQVQVHEPVGREPRRVGGGADGLHTVCLLYTNPSPRDPGWSGIPASG
jgi:hypothetical protein